MGKDLVSQKKQDKFAQVYQEVAYKAFLEVNSLARIRQQFVERGVSLDALDAAESRAKERANEVAPVPAEPEKRPSRDDRLERAYEQGKASKSGDENPWEHWTYESKEWRTGYGYARGLESASNDENPFNTKGQPRERKGWALGHALAHVPTGQENSTARSAQ